jgi:RES domain-containing protein
VILWRIASETRQYAADDLSGAGAAKAPGRWNQAGEPVIYSASSIALAVLETVAHLDDAGLPQNRMLVRIEVPKPVWAARQVRALADLPPAWAAIPAGRASVEIGSAWLRRASSALLLVPSVIVPEEYAVLINPRHPDAASITARSERVFEYHRVLGR